MYGVLSWAAPPRPPSRRSRRSPVARSPPGPAGPPPSRRVRPGIRRSLPSVHSSRSSIVSSELQPALAGGVGQRGDPAVVAVATPVEHDRGDAGLLGTGGDELADLGRAGLLVAVERRARRPPCVDADASVWPARSSMSCTTMCRELRLTDQARPLGAAADLLAQPDVPAGPRDAALARRLARRSASGASRRSSRPSHLLTRLSDLAADVLAGVAHALALVRVGLAQLADVGGDLADQLLVDAGDREPGRASRPRT